MTVVLFCLANRMISCAAARAVRRKGVIKRARDTWYVAGARALRNAPAKILVQAFVLLTSVLNRALTYLDALG